MYLDRGRQESGDFLRIQLCLAVCAQGKWQIEADLAAGGGIGQVIPSEMTMLKSIIS